MRAMWLDGTKFIEQEGCRGAVGKDVPAGTVAVVRYFDSLRAINQIVTALSTLVRQRRLAPSCGGLAPTAERKAGAARMFASLTLSPGIREQNRPRTDLWCHFVFVFPVFGRFDTTKAGTVFTMLKYHSPIP
jgi:hypothetical protein